MLTSAVPLRLVLLLALSVAAADEVSAANATTKSSNSSEMDILFLQKFRYYTEGVVLTPISLFGIFGNILSIFVLSCPEMRSNFNQLLIALASFDLLYLLLSLALFAMPKISTWYQAEALPVVMPIGYGFAHIGRVGSVFMTLSVTVERFVAIAYPLKKIRLKRSLILASVGGAVIYNVPRFFEWRSCEVVKHNETTGEHTSTTYVEPTELRYNPIYVQLYVVWMKFFLVELLPYITILVLNAIMIVRIRSAMKVQKQMTTSTRSQSQEAQRKELNMALVLICIVVMFIVCQSVKIVPDIYEAVFCNHSSTQSCRSTLTNECVVSLSYVFLGINSASNFIIYMLRGNKFRRVLSRKMLQLCGKTAPAHFDSPRLGNSFQADQRSHVVHLEHQPQNLSAPATGYNKAVTNGANRGHREGATNAQGGSSKMTANSLKSCSTVTTATTSVASTTFHVKGDFV